MCVSPPLDNTYIAPIPQYVAPAPAPCPSCGHCPTCGRGNGWYPIPPFNPWTNIGSGSATFELPEGTIVLYNMHDTFDYHG